MATKISTKSRNVAGDSIVNLLDGGITNPNGRLEIRTGLPPANPQVAATGTLLATLNLSNPAFGNFANGSSFANPIANDIDVDESGEAGWFRLYDRDGNAVIDGTITKIGDGGDIEFDNIDFIKGGTALITSLTATVLE